MSGSSTILGISPGTKSAGIAIFRNDQLIYWRLKTFKGKCSERKIKAIFSALKKIIANYGVEAIAVKTSSLSSVGSDRLVSEIQDFAKSEKIKILSFTLPELKNNFAQDSKKSLVEHVATKFPELFSEWNKENSSRNSYYIKIFEAVAAAALIKNTYS